MPQQLISSLMCRLLTKRSAIQIKEESTTNVGRSALTSPKIKVVWIRLGACSATFLGK